MSSKTKTSTTSSTNQTQTPQVPDWYANPTQTAAGNVGQLINQGAGAYTPGISQLQQQATTGAQNLNLSPLYGNASDIVSGVGDVGHVGASSVLDNLSAYETPYRDQVLNPVLSDYDQQAGITRAAQQADAAKGGAFGGSRYGIAQAQTEDNLARGRAATEGGLLQNLYTQATGLSEADAGRRQQITLANQQADEANRQAQFQKASALANLAQGEGADTRSNLALQSQLGGIQTNAENQIKQYPLAYQQEMEGLLQGLDPSLFTGQNTTGTSSSTSTQSQQPGLMDIAKTGLLAAAMFTPAGPALAGVGAGLGGVGTALGGLGGAMSAYNFLGK